MQQKIKILAILFSVIMAFGIMSCSDDDPTKGGKHPLTGTWYGGKLEYFDPDNSYEEQSGIKYVFKKNGSGTAQSFRYGEFGRLDKFTDYMVAEGHLYIKWEGDDDYDDKGAINIHSKNTFYLMIEDTKWIFGKK